MSPWELTTCRLIHGAGPWRPLIRSGLASSLTWSLADCVTLTETPNFSVLASPRTAGDSYIACGLGCVHSTLSLANWGPQTCVLIFCCCGNKCPQTQLLKTTYTHSSSQFLWVRSPGMDYRDPLLRVSQNCSHSVCWEWGHLRLGVLFQTHVAFGRTNFLVAMEFIEATSSRPVGETFLLYHLLQRDSPDQVTSTQDNITFD